MSATINYPYGPESVSEADETGILTPTTSSAFTDADHSEEINTRIWTPSNGSTVIIRSVSCGNVMTLLDGEVVLAPLGSRGSMYWTCVEFDGWFGFRNRVTNKFLCHHGGNTQLKCSADEGASLKHFTITPVSNGGHVLQMLDWWKLRTVVIKRESGQQKLARTGEKIIDGVVWEFVKID